MAGYNKTTWLDRVVQFPMRFTKSGETSTSVTLTGDPGTVTQLGTPINAANLNKMEQGIDEAHSLDVDNVTIADTVVPASDTVAPKTFFNNVANMIKQITGKANWRTTPRTTLENAVKLNGDTMTGVLDNTTGYQWGGVTMAQTRTTNGYVEWFNGSTWEGVGGVKSIQRGLTGTSGTNPYIVNVTISAVNMAKSTVNVNGQFTFFSDGSGGYPYVRLTSSTNLEIKSSGINGNIAWEVIEHY